MNRMLTGIQPLRLQEVPKEHAPLVRRRICIGLPAYNEEVALPRLLARIEQLLGRWRESVTVVIYNDGSTDATAQIAREWETRLPLVLLGFPQNKGLGAGLRALISHAASTGGADDFLVIMDCDDTHDPAQIEEMLRTMDRGADVVIASRFVRGSLVRGVSRLRRLTAVGAATVFKLVHPVRGVWDYTCGYRCYRVCALKRAISHYPAGLVQEAGFACMVEVLLKMNALKFCFREIPLQLRYDQKPTESKMDVSANITRLLTLLVRWRWRGFGVP